MNRAWNGRNWTSSLLIAAGVVTAILMALLMSPLDQLQTTLRPSPQPIAITNPTRSALPATLFPTITPKSTAVPTNTPAANETPTTAAIAILPVCPPPPPGWQPYTVQAGDSLSSLAVQFRTSQSKLEQVNCLSPNVLTAGIVIYVPPATAPVVVVACGPLGGWGTGWVGYLVQPGDTLFSLARRYHTTVYEIVMANCLDISGLRWGVRILLPPVVFPTATSTATATATPSATATSTATATGTATGTPSPTWTATPTATLTITVTLTATPTATGITTTPTSTATPSSTPTASATAGATATTTATATPTATNTAVPSATATPTHTAIPPTATATPTPTDTAVP